MICENNVQEIFGNMRFQNAKLRIMIRVHFSLQILGWNHMACSGLHIASLHPKTENAKLRSPSKTENNAEGE